ncbi:MAG: tetratricopeptide repeat protein [Terriglobia bacterium]
MFSCRFSPSIMKFWLTFFALCLFPCAGAWAQALSSSSTLDEYFRKAGDLETRGDYLGAEKVYLEAAQSFPLQSEVFKRLGLIYQTELKFNESIDSFQKVLKQAPQYPEVNFYLGLSYLGLNQYEKAIEAFEKELEANPKYRRARYFEAVAYRSMNRHADALRQYEILLQQDPTDKKVLFQLIKLLKASTLEALNQLGDLDANSVYMMVFKAESYVEGERYPEAVQKYNEVLAKDPNFPGIHFALGECYYKKVDYANAEQELRLALKEDPYHPMANFYLADILIKNQKMPDAIPRLETVVTSAPLFMLGYLELGKCYMATGRTEDALKLLLKAVELQPKEKMVHYQLAQAYTRLKQPDKQQYHLSMFETLDRQERDKKKEKMKALNEKAMQKQNDADAN